MSVYTTGQPAQEQVPIIIVPDPPWYAGWLPPTIGGVVGPIIVFLVTRKWLRVRKAKR